MNLHCNPCRYRHSVATVGCAAVEPEAYCDDDKRTGLQAILELLELQGFS
jgi:hypothetical protein